MHVAITGSSGLIGSRLRRTLAARGHHVSRLVRRPPRDGDELGWDPDAGRLDPAVLRGVDVVVHLGGEPIDRLRPMVGARRRRVWDSRVGSTRLLAEAIATVDDGPRALVVANGVNIYGDRGDTPLTEDDADERADGGFLLSLTHAWEAAAQPAREAGRRVVTMRTGIVQSPAGGPLAKLLPIFRAGVGGRFGSGRQYWSWIDLDDAIGLYVHAIEQDAVEGPLNVTAPTPVTNREFTRTLARVLRRPAVVPVPLLGPALLLGPSFAREMLYTSARVLPAKAEATGYTFRQPELEPCLRTLLDRPLQPHG